MSTSGNSHTTPPGQGGDGVRVVAKARPARRAALFYKLLAVVLVGAGIACLLQLPKTPRAVAGTGAETPVREARDAGQPAGSTDAMPTARRMPAPLEDPVDLPSRDRDDIAAWIRPGDPEPTVAEVIDALHHVGIRSGIAAFNPPGTSPPLEGLAVPEDYELPEGYVRHHQVTDEGEPIEAILMFSPDYTFHDDQGRPIQVPENRVVPPELAPPGLPLRRVRIPSSKVPD
ncbi:hypothetical protein [Marilutibacter alkalisoli]|uniref:Uncharacterized protein n=1 Tax=Marilutibacter alkalisoli TaxID=2591633 RepID=A0A514BVT1_9GAMM|nr:hypothetical protein [Lysobacter alkalisoli]QDH71149.1 hypothetical protein FKV23_14430 [Lysobacter alkalisoli]